MNWSNPRKATGLDCVPTKVIKTASQIVDGFSFD